MSASRLRHFIPEKMVPGTQYIRGCVIRDPGTQYIGSCVKRDPGTQYIGGCVKRVPGTQYIGGCVKCLTGLEVLEKIKIHYPCCELTHYSPVFCPADEINIKAILNDIYQDL